MFALPARAARYETSASLFERTAAPPIGVFQTLDAGKSRGKPVLGSSVVAADAVCVETVAPVLESAVTV
jgi:hypothetical protein